MSLEKILNELPVIAKDIKLNTAMVLTESGSPGLTQKQIFLIALACAYAIKNQTIIAVLQEEVVNYLTPEEVAAAKAAAMIMAMNNVYYRFVHVVGDQSYKTMPAKLRMNIINQSGAKKLDFELASLAVSALNGCSACMEAHIQQVIQGGGLSKEAVQSAVRIGAVLNALAVVV